MMYIVLETFWQEDIYISKDENGNTLLFDDKEKAEEAARNLQQGIVVEVNPKA